MMVVYNEFEFASEEDAKKVLNELEKLNHNGSRIYLSDLKDLSGYEDKHYSDSLLYWDNLDGSIVVQIDLSWYLALPRIKSVPNG